MKDLSINNVSQLNSLNDVIHDEYFCLNDIKFDKNILEIPFRRIFHYYSPVRIIKQGLLSKIGEVDVLRCVLKISNVNKYEIIDKSRIGTYSFNEVRYNYESKVLTINTNESCDLNITSSVISIEYIEVEYRGTAKIRYGIFGENSSSKVYE